MQTNNTRALSFYSKNTRQWACKHAVINFQWETRTIITALQLFGKQSGEKPFFSFSWDFKGSSINFFSLLMLLYRLPFTLYSRLLIDACIHTDYIWYKHYSFYFMKSVLNTCYMYHQVSYVVEWFFCVVPTNNSPTHFLFLTLFPIVFCFQFFV